MEQNESQLEDYSAFEMVLRLYFYFDTKEQNAQKEAWIFEEKANNESLVGGIRYDKVVSGSGCSVNYGSEKVNYNLRRAIECSQEAKAFKKAKDTLNLLYGLKNKINALENEKKSLILQVYKLGYSFSTVAKLSSKDISKQAVANKTRKIIQEMLKEAY